MICYSLVQDDPKSLSAWCQSQLKRFLRKETHGRRNRIPVNLVDFWTIRDETKAKPKLLVALDVYPQGVDWAGCQGITDHIDIATRQEIRYEQRSQIVI
jgi:hypothetical protein